MIYNRHSFESHRTIALSASFSPNDNDDALAEHHIIISHTDPTADFDTQLASIESTATEMLALLGSGTDVVLKRYFLSDVANQAHRIERSGNYCLSAIGQPPLNGSKVALWMYAITNADIRRNQAGVTEFKHNAYTHIFAGGITAGHNNSKEETISILNEYAAELNELNCTLKDNCVRTWFFVRDIDINYSGVVEGRNMVFRANDLTTDTHFIASTGIGGIAPSRSSLVTMDAYSIHGLKEDQITYLHAPEMMNATHEYGVAFERGTAISYGDRRHVIISGTASIDNKGQIMHQGNVKEQALRMLKNVESLLAKAGCDWNDTTHIIVYLRDIADTEVVRDIMRAHLPNQPMIIVEAPVCRPGWLIEMECMAICRQSAPQYDKF